MKMMTKAAHDKAVDYLKTQARPLERALYAYHFESAPAADVLSELAHYQNADGGFGHALEPDMRLADSSVIQTSVAFQRLRDLKTPTDHPMVVNACRYLLNQYDDSRVDWPTFPANIDDAPHAPWWTLGGDLDKSPSNPRAEITGYLHTYASNFPDELRQKVTQSVMDYLMSQPDNMEMHDFLCYLRLLESDNLPEKIRARLLDKLTRIVNTIVVRDPAQWKAYGLPPLAVISDMDSPFAAAFKDVIPQNLDFIIENQSEAGLWEPNWTWGGMWPEVWEQAKRDWTGVMTLDALVKLRVFHRLA